MDEIDRSLDLQAIEDLLRRSISAMKARGMFVAPGAFGVTYYDQAWHHSGVYVCLIGAVVLLLNPPHGLMPSFFESVMGISNRQGRSLIGGFEGTMLDDAHDPASYAVGQRLRQESIQTIAAEDMGL